MLTESPDLKEENSSGDVNCTSGKPTTIFTTPEYLLAPSLSKALTLSE